jgi:hypothetical protein
LSRRKLGDGVYSTYAARNASGAVLSIVTDFKVLG